ncbi:MAG: hypothetical protein U0003_01130 [Vampirovibrionales bacterium]
MSDALPNNPSHERRTSNQDRRGANRSGKLDRRKNHCGGCSHFIPPVAPSLPAEPGFCQHHSRPFSAQDYACRSYQINLS